MISCDRKGFYKASNVKEVTKYTLWQAYAEETRAGHFGPWVEKYRALCGDVKNGKVRA